MSYETDDKMVSHPDHYKSGKYEVIDIIDEFTKDLSGTEAVCTANAIKYILRWKKKNGIQDVKKAIWYLQHMVDKEEERLREEHAEFDEELLKKKEVDMDKIMNRPTFIDVKEEIHSCDDCVYKTNEPWDDPCQSCDLHQNPPSKWESEENVTITDKQVVYAAKVISKYCNNKSGCIDGKCPFFDDDESPVGCELSLNLPNAWNIEEKK